MRKTVLAAPLALVLAMPLAACGVQQGDDANQDGGGAIASIETEAEVGDAQGGAEAEADVTYTEYDKYGVTFDAPDGLNSFGAYSDGAVMLYVMSEDGTSMLFGQSNADGLTADDMAAEIDGAAIVDRGPDYVVVEGDAADFEMEGMEGAVRVLLIDGKVTFTGVAQADEFETYEPIWRHVAESLTYDESYEMSDADSLEMFAELLSIMSAGEELSLDGDGDADADGVEFEWEEVADEDADADDGDVEYEGGAEDAEDVEAVG